MTVSVLDAIGTIAMCSPFLVIVAILSHYCLKRSAWKRRKQEGRRTLGFCPSSVAPATAFLFMPVFYRPSVSFVIEARQREDVKEDDEGDPETPAKHLQWQLRRIRRGEPVEMLVLRL
jgi:hypothetical protein